MSFTRNAILGFLFLTILWTSACEEYDRSEVIIAGGKLDQVMLLMDDDLVETSFSDSIAMEFAAPIPVMPQPEPKFIINIRDFSRYQNASSVFHKYRNLSFFGFVEGNSAAMQFIRQQLGDQKVKQMMRNNQLFTTRQNEFAQNQQVVYMVAANKQRFYEMFAEQKDELFRTIRQFSNQRLTKQTFMEGRNQKMESTIENTFGFSMKVPANFNNISDTGGVIWLNKETIFQNKQNVQTKKIREDIFITSYKGKKKKQFYNLQNSNISDRVDKTYPFVIMDTIASNFIFGKSPKYPVYIDQSQPIFQQERTINGIKVTDSRALWRCDRPLMGGFAYTITFEHPRTNELIVLFGYVYAAGSDKRPIHRKYDVIYNSISLPEQS